MASYYVEFSAKGTDPDKTEAAYDWLLTYDGSVHFGDFKDSISLYPLPANEKKAKAFWLTFEGETISNPTKHIERFIERLVTEWKFKNITATVEKLNSNIIYKYKAKK